MRILTLLTDFGETDPYVGIMKGVVLSNVDVHIVDITHQIPHGDIKRAAFFLKFYPLYFPEGSVHLVVVDPTVGSIRRGIVSLYENRYFIGPDNGVLTPVLGEVFEIGIKPISKTFHGRDVFAPAAAKVLKGMELNTLGKRIYEPVKIKLPEPVVGDFIKGEVILIDRFGNLITNIPEKMIENNAFIQYKGVKIPLRDTYADVKAGEPLALINSYGLLEISVNQGSARDMFKGEIGDDIKIRRSHG